MIAVCGALALAAGALRRVPAPVWVLAALGLYSLLQSLPMPIGFLERLSPAAAVAWSRSLLPFSEPVRFGSLSVDPGATTVEAAKWLAYAVAFWLAVAFGRRRGARAVIGLVFLCALAVSLATLGHGLVGASRVFGVYEPQLGTSATRVGPILNPNTLAGYLLLGTFSGFGLMLSTSEPLQRWLWGAGTAVVVGSALLSGSRGGVAALILGVLVLAAYAFRAREQLKARRFTWYDWCGGAAAIAAAVLFSILGARNSWFELTHGDLSKLQMSSWVIPMLRDFPVFGVGRGAFETAFPFYKPVSDNLIYAHPENLVAQWLSEWGLVAGGLGIATLCWLLRPSRIGLGRQPLASAAGIGVAALVLQNLVDFSLELFAPMLAAVLILGACWGQSDPAVKVERSRGLRQKLPAAGLVALTLGCVGIAAGRGSSPVSLDRLRLQSQYEQLDLKGGGAETEALWSDIRSAIQRHPAEPYFPRLAAALALRVGDVEPLPWINRSLERGPVDSRTHWLLARALQRHGFLQQALLEARLAVEYDQDLAAGVGATVARWSTDANDIRRAAPRGHAGAQVQLSAARVLDRDQHPLLRQELYRGALRHDPGFATAHRALAEELLYGLQRDRYQGDERTRAEAEVLQQASRLASLKPESADSSEVLARLYTLTGQVEEADRILSPRCPTLGKGERLKCWRALLVAARAQPGHRPLVERVTRQLVSAACGFERDCHRSLLQAGDAMAALGNWPEALDYFQRAAREEPTVPTLIKVSEAAAAVGRFQIADRALTLAASHARENPAQRAQVEAKKRALLQRGPRPPGPQTKP